MNGIVEENATTASPSLRVPDPQGQETRLIRESQAGSNEAFDGLVALHQSRVFNISLRLVGDRETALDCAQEAFLRAYHAIRSFRGDCAFTTWLYRITSNVCMDELRRRKPTESLSADEDETADPLERLAEDGPGPEQRLLQEERRRAVLKALGRLPELHRSVLVLYDLQGLSYEEVAGVLQVSLGTVKSRLNRARLALKEALESVKELFED